MRGVVGKNAIIGRVADLFVGEQISQRIDFSEFFDLHLKHVQRRRDVLPESLT